LLFKKEEPNSASYRPLSSKKVEELLQEKKNNLFFTLEKSEERKSLRPKSSFCSARQHQHRARNNNNNPTSTTIEDASVKSIILAEEVSRSSSFKLQSNDPKFIDIDYPQIVNVRKHPKPVQSNRSSGHICGYAVNSHKFMHSSELSEGRILLISNLTKTQKPEHLTSLYCIF
jgi:hypothetical protein